MEFEVIFKSNIIIVVVVIVLVWEILKTLIPIEQKLSRWRFFFFSCIMTGCSKCRGQTVFLIWSQCLEKNNDGLIKFGTIEANQAKPSQAKPIAL